VRATAGAASDLAAWVGHVRASWPGVRVLHVESTGEGDVPVLGTALGVRAVVDLGGLLPDDVSVELAWGRVDDHDEVHDATSVPLPLVSSDDGVRRYEGELTLDRPGPIGYTVRVLPHHPLLASGAELGLIASA